VTVLPASSPFTSLIVRRSARHWHGCSKSERAFTTGTEAAEASTSSRSCSKVRSTIAWTYLDRTRPVSSIVSPRPSWRSAEDSGTGCPPVEATAISKETRVRVEGFSKIIATERPARRSAKSPGWALTLADSSSSWPSSLGERSSIDSRSRSIARV
jgi:hypothetical protein